MKNRISISFSDLKINAIWSQSNPGWGPIRKWPLIRSSPTRTVCSQTKITGSGIYFERSKVWSEVISVWEWYDQRSISGGNGLIRGHFRLGWSDQRWIQAHTSLISVFERNWVWLDLINLFFRNFLYHSILDYSMCLFLSRVVGGKKTKVY